MEPPQKRRSAKQKFMPTDVWNPEEHEEDEGQDVVDDGHEGAGDDLGHGVRALDGQLIIQWDGTVIAHTLQNARCVQAR